MSETPRQSDTPVQEGDIPRHVAIVMDGNGRWAKARGLPRVAGHKAGVETVRNIVQQCVQKGIEALTLFAFSSENWRRPPQEVGLLMELFLTALQMEVSKLNKNNVRLRVIGDISAFSEKLRNQMTKSQEQTRNNTGLTLVIAVNYGGRWDLAQASRRVAEQVAAGTLKPEQVDEELLGRYVCLHDLPEPDLFIRTSGEQRISNFLLWQLAYTELYFTDTRWPDFDASAFDQALLAYQKRRRRFGLTDEQLAQVKGA